MAVKDNNNNVFVGNILLFMLLNMDNRCGTGLILGLVVGQVFH